MQSLNKKRKLLFPYPWISIIIFTALLTNTHLLIATEITPFKIQSYNGSLSLRHWSNEAEVYTLNAISQKSDQQVWQEELSLNILSYIYHPNFLNMDLSAGIVYDQTTFDSLAYDYDTNEQLTSFSARLNFLSKRPFPFTIYYNKESPSVATGATTGYFLENEKYGADISLLRPFSPAQMKLSTFKQTSYGYSAERIVNDVIEQVKFNTSYSYGSANTIMLNHQNNNRISSTGSIYLPITEKKSSIYSTNIETKNIFGFDDEFRLISRAGHNEQEEHPVRESWFFKPDLRWRHDENLSSFYRYETNTTNELDREIKNDNIATGLTYNQKSFGTALDAYINRNQSTGFEFEDKGAQLSLSDKHVSSYGDYNYNYNVRINLRNQISALSLIPVYGDEYTLSGITPETIKYENIDTTTIIVSNATQTQIYIEDLDYSITKIGEQTYINRLTGGNIVDGETILIDYSYRTGGTMNYSQITQSLYINLATGRHYDFYTRLYQSKQDLKQGLPTIQLNSSHGLILGLRMDRPLINEITVGSELVNQTHHDDSNPYNKQNIDVFFNFLLPSRSSMKLNAGWLLVDNKNSNEDINRKLLMLRLQSRPWPRVKMSIESNYEEDTGGLINRQLYSNTLQFDWNYRQLNYRAYAKNQTEKQGNFERNRQSFYMQLRRNF